MCLKNLQKYLVHGVLIEAEILTSPLPHVFGQLGPEFRCWCSAHGCVNASQVVWNIPMCLRNFSNYLGHGVLIETEILTSPLPHVFATLGLVVGHSTLPTGGSTPLKQYRNVSMCLRNLQTKFGAWVPNRNWHIDLPLPHVFATLGLDCGCRWSAPG